MCGINGIYRFDDQNPNQAVIHRMMKRQKHRGPDDEGVFIEKKIGLGFVRLSILDLTDSGHQPMQDNSQRYVIVFNGEIYNYIELREELLSKGVQFRSNSDTEVLLNMYIYYGNECLDRLNGMFAFVIYDKLTGNVFGARDRFGVKPFYYYLDKHQFVFASEIPPILEAIDEKVKANDLSIYEYLLYNRTDQTENTFFDGILKLQHGHYFEIKNNQFSISSWYNLSDKISPEKFDPEKYKELLVDSVRLRLRSDVPVGVCLSGGIDSSSIVSVISKELGKNDVHTFSAIYGNNEKGDESKFIDLYKDELQNMHFVEPKPQYLIDSLSKFIEVQAEPIPTTSPFAQYCVMELAKKNVTVTLDGQGADEALGGYQYFFGFYFKELLKKAKLRTLTKEVANYYKKHKSFAAYKFFIYFLLPKSIKNLVSSRNVSYLNKNFIKEINKSNKPVIVKELYGSKDLQDSLLNHFQYKLEHLLKWNDRNSMAFSVESRTPFLDYRLVEYTLSLPSDSKIKNGETKYVLRESMKGILPEKIRKRNDKIGFETPQDKWFRLDQFKNLINEILNSKSFNNRKYINADKAKKLYEKHLAGEINISRDIWKWINLELWFRKYMD